MQCHLDVCLYHVCDHTHTRRTLGRGQVWSVGMVVVVKSASTAHGGVEMLGGWVSVLLITGVFFGFNFVFSWGFAFCESVFSLWVCFYFGVFLCCEILILFSSSVVFVFGFIVGITVFSRVLLNCVNFVVFFVWCFPVESV